MTMVRYIYWQEEYHWPEGETVDDLKEHLRDLFADLSQDRIPEVRRTAELEVG